MNTAIAVFCVITCSFDLRTLHNFPVLLNIFVGWKDKKDEESSVSSMVMQYISTGKISSGIRRGLRKLYVKTDLHLQTNMILPDCSPSQSS